MPAASCWRGTGAYATAPTFGSQACLLGYRTLYFNCGKLFQLLKEKRADGGYRRFVARLARIPLLILDDFGLTPLDTEDRLSLLEIIEDRCGSNATLIASQIPVAKWFDLIGDPTIADAICDRLVSSGNPYRALWKLDAGLQGQGSSSRGLPQSCQLITVALSYLHGVFR